MEIRRPPFSEKNFGMLSLHHSHSFRATSGSASARKARQRRAGFTLLDVMMAAVVLAVAISGLSGAILVAMSLNRVNRDTAIAQQAARQAIEQLEGRTFNEVFAAYNGNVGDDAGLLAPAVGAGFAVAGLQPLVGDADGLCGRVMFPVTTVGAVEQLREDVVDAALGMPADLNGDGAIDALNHAVDFRLLPVRIRIEWLGSVGPRQIDFETILSLR